MAEGQGETLELMKGLVAHMRQVVGEGACYAMLHYGATEEGKRVGAAATALPDALARLDGMMLQRTQIVRDEGAAVWLRVHSSALSDADAGRRAMHGIVLGLVEGALTASRAGRYRGTLVEGPGELLIELRRVG